MTPMEYKRRYENLSVTLTDGTSVPIRIDQYRLKGLTVNAQGRTDFAAALNNHGFNTEITVDTTNGPRTATSTTLTKGQYGALAAYVFLGKGSPEASQIVLALAQHWGLPGTDNLQQYANLYLGLDCNGFVGNYLWHDKRSMPWTNIGVANHDEGPDMAISGYTDRRRALTNWDDIDESKSYILGMVNGSDEVVDGGSVANAGHIAITEAGTQDRTIAGSYSLAIRAVESTYSRTPGLGDTWYTLRNPASTRSAKGIYEMDRGAVMRADKRYVRFKIVRLD